jgi:FkbM family methyltransferase
VGAEDATVHVEIDGLRFSGTSAHRAYLEKVRLRQREAFMAELLQDAVRPGATVVDIGAFVGYFALLAARKAGRRGRVVAFEPDRRDFPWLVRNIEDNGFGDRVTASPDAVADREGWLTFFLADEDRTQSGFFPPPDGGTRVEVECTTLDLFLGGGPVDVVKIDVEGAELRTLAGMEASLAASGDQVTMFVEWNPGTLRQAELDPDVLIDRLEKLGFTPQLIDEHARRLRPPGPFEGAYANLYCTRR